MRKWLVIAAACLLAVVGGAVLWPKAPGPGARASQASRGPEATRALPEFTQVEVASEEGEGLTLTGRVLDAAGRPLPGAEVSLAASAQRTLTAVRCEECGQALLACPAHSSVEHVRALFEEGKGFLGARATARTDEQGRFRFERLAGVSFSVWARAPGHGVSLRERAAPGEPVELYLPPLRSIAGQVLDDAGQPVAGARVHAVSRRTALPHEAVTGGDGRFLLEGLGEGPFYVLASARGLLASAESQVEAGPQPVRLKLLRPRALRVRVVRQGAPAVATVRLEADHLSRALRTEGAPVRFDGLLPDRVVVVAEAEGLGSAPRTVELEELLSEVTLELEDAGRLLVTVVDEAGQPVPTPELVLRTAQGEVLRRQKAQTGALVELGPLAAGNYVVEGQAEGFQPAQLPARVKAGETALELELARATVLSGRVMDVYGRPAPGVSVLAQPTGETTLADAEGFFSLPVPSPGLYELHAHHSEWGGGSVKATAPASGVELGLEPRAALEVTVSSEGRRVEGADVMLWVEREGIFRSDRPSGPDGVVPMRGLPPSTYWMVASHPDYLPSQRQQVRVEDGQTLRLEVELPPGASLEGEVVDTQGAPVDGAVVTVAPRGGQPATSDGRGHFELRALRPGQAYRVEARHPAYDQVARVEGRAGGPAVRLELRRRGVFRGRVVDGSGAPVRRFRLDSHDVSAPDGRFEVPLSTVGERVVLSVDAPGFEPLLVDRPATADLGDLVLQRAPVFSGRVVEEGGGPVADAVVSCDVCDESVMTGPDGRFELPAPPFVKQFVVSARRGRLSSSRQVQRGEGGPVELQLRPATRLYGTAYQADGRPAAGVPLEGVHADRGDPLTMVTGPDGSFSTEAPPGVYRFMLGEGRAFAGQPLLVVQVAGPEMRLDLGPAPGSAPLTVQLRPERGMALWVVAGEVSSRSPSTAELMRSRYAQLIYQPRGPMVTLQGLPPGRYTLVWAPFHAEGEDSTVLRTVDVPAAGEVALAP